MDFIISPQLLTMGDAQSLSRLYKDFISKDYFMALLDLEDYIAVKERCLTDYLRTGTPGAAGCWSILPALDSFPPIVLSRNMTRISGI